MATVKAANTITVGFTQDLAYGIAQIQTIAEPLPLASVFSISGTAADQCTKLYSGRLTFTASTPQNVDLQSLVDASGATISFNAIRFLGIKNNATTDGWVLLVGAAGANEWDGITSASGTLTVYPSTAVNSGFVLFQIPNTAGSVVDGTHHLLKLDPGTHAFTVDLLIAGI